jgi:hypothetical protein
MGLRDGKTMVMTGSGGTVGATFVVNPIDEAGECRRGGYSRHTDRTNNKRS